MNFIKKLLLKFKQFIRFGIVGFINTILNLIIYWTLILMIDPIIASGIGYFATSVIGFLLNKQWVFKKDSKSLHKTLLKFYVIYGSSLLITVLLTSLFTRVLHINEYIVPILCLVVTIPYNFLLSKFWVFRENNTISH